ncbi:galactose mutarotase-like enzyme [Mycobacterium sp. JS623]|uniref:aldose 1-epimerase n=1 Tax=Mycobacterium sp. JS623 TaxID=212767 RepID=UPI0002A5ACC1|nr:aldose 1-epimerase [Mycobacterium sp. JS623]AGB20831.1 galactose mutarotase-like enzyme [Mycobacterium sp. JS623]
MPELETVTLRDSSGLSAVYVPGAGMIATSLSDAGTELLGQRRGLDAYLSAGKTMGIPLLYPWANRLSARTYAVDGSVVTLAPDAYGVHTDNNGLPIHGLLAGYPGWRTREVAEQKLTAELDFGAHAELLASFPFPHLLEMTVELSERTLTVSTTVTPTADRAVPVAYGYHPYLQLPDVPRSEWQIEMPTMRHMMLDDTGIPNGATAESTADSEPLGDKLFDDGFDQVAEGAVFAVSGGGRRLEVCFERGYPAAQVFAPASETVMCFEPMTAPTDALRRGGYRTARPGVPDTAVFSIRVS